MVTFHYFCNYFVLLVLQSSVFIYAQEPVPPSTLLPQPTPPPVNIEPVLPAKSNDSLAPTNATLNATNTDNAKATPPNKEFPENPPNGTKVFCLDKTQETPLTNATSKTLRNANNTNCQPNTNTGVNTPVDDAGIDIEVPDLLNSNETRETEEAVEKTPVSPIQISGTNESINNEVELIENGQNTEDILRSPSHQEANAPGVPLVQGQLAAILAAVFVVISVVAYIALLSWRRYLEKRYGDRQMLVNENELSDRDDLRHFSI